MRRPRRTARHPFARGLRAAVPAACVLLLLVGTVEWHGDAAAHLPVPAAGHGDGGLSVTACPDEHGDRSHVEPARSAEREHCAACLHRFQRAGGATVGPAAAGQDDGSTRLTPPRRTVRSTPVLDRAPSRGPPAA